MSDKKLLRQCFVARLIVAIVGGTLYALLDFFLKLDESWSALLGVAIVMTFMIIMERALTAVTAVLVIIWERSLSKYHLGMMRYHAKREEVLEGCICGGHKRSIRRHALSLSIHTRKYITTDVREESEIIG